MTPYPIDKGDHIQDVYMYTTIYSYWFKITIDKIGILSIILSRILDLFFKFKKRGGVCIFVKCNEVYIIIY